MAKRWDSSRMCWIRCKAGMSAGKCSSSWLSPGSGFPTPPCGSPPWRCPPAAGICRRETPAGRQDLLRAAQLAETAVDEQHIRHLVRLLLLAKATLQRLLHGGVVIPAGDTVDVEAAVFRGERPPVEHHAGGHGALPMVWEISKHSMRAMGSRAPAAPPADRNGR